MTSGLKKFEKHLHPQVLTAIKGWGKHPELSKLLKKLQSIKDWEQFLDYFAEVMVAQHLIGQGCRIEGYEVPTINRRSADFKVSKIGDTFFVHVKHLNFDKEMRHDLNVGKRLDILRKKGICFSFYKSLTDEEMQRFHKEAKEFSKKGMTGETKVILSTTGEKLGKCYKSKNSQVSSSVYSVKEGDDSSRFSDKLSDAYRQFMPDAVNVILVTSAWRDDPSVEDLQRSLDDFWHAGKHSCSNIIIWFEFDPREKEIDCKLFFRENYKKPKYIIDAFGQNCQVMRK